MKNQNLKYSVDKVKFNIECVKVGYVQAFMFDMGNMSNVLCSTSMAMKKCHYNYNLQYEEGNIYVGVAPNWKKEDRDVKTIILEFNPNKVNPLLIDELNFLRNVPVAFWKVMSIDLAVDMDIPYNTLVMLKRDKREYMASIGHSEVETRYLGAFGANGHIKLYDKAKEQKVDKDWSRFEITLKNPPIGATIERFKDICKIPSVYRKDVQLSVSYSNINAITRIALNAIISDINELYTITDYKTRKKMEKLLHECLENIDINVGLMYQQYTSFLNTWFNNIVLFGDIVPFLT